MVLGQEVFIDLSYLRVGTFLDTWIEGNYRVVKFRPLNSLRAVVIKNIPKEDNVLREVNRFAGVSTSGSFSKVHVLFAGEFGKAPFLEEYLRDYLNPELIKKLDEVTRGRAVDWAVLQTQKRQIGRGEDEILDKVMDRVQRMKRSREEEGFRFKRREVY